MSHLISREELKKIVNDLHNKIRFGGGNRADDARNAADGIYSKINNIFNNSEKITKEPFDLISNFLDKLNDNVYYTRDLSDSKFYGILAKNVNKTYSSPNSGLILQNTFDKLKETYNNFMACFCHNDCRCHSNCHNSSSCNDGK